MGKWSFRVEGNSEGAIEKLETAFGKLNGFVFETTNENTNSIKFKLRKRILYGWYMAFQNWTIVSGTMLDTRSEDETIVKISFGHHFLIKTLVFTHIFLVVGLLVGLFLGLYSNTSTYILGGIVFTLGVILGVTAQNKFKQDTQKFKMLISEILRL